VITGKTLGATNVILSEAGVPLYGMTAESKDPYSLPGGWNAQRHFCGRTALLGPRQDERCLEEAGTRANDSMAR